ncbi:MAG: hypothetical protein PHR79_05175, partial [Bacteroidales bacterium]|nr:hypothetical protein [Bacteroidales bacterium]
MRKIFTLLLVLSSFFLFSQVKLVNPDATKIYPDDTRITYMELSGYPVDAHFLQFVEKEVLTNTLIQRFKLAKDGKTCFYHSHKDITEEMIVDAINDAYYLFYTKEAYEINKQDMDKSLSKEDYDKATVQNNYDKSIKQNKLIPISALNQKKWKADGIFGGFTPQQEILEKRTQNTKHFQKENGDIVAQIGGNYHYQ